MVKFGQGVLAVFAGCLVAMVVMGVAQTVGLGLFPLPASFDLSKPTTLEAIMAAMPAGAFACNIAGWAIGTFIGSSVASKLAAGRKLGHGLAVGALLMASSVRYMIAIPHPTWIWAGLVVFLPMAFLGGTLGSLQVDRSYPVPDPA